MEGHHGRSGRGRLALTAGLGAAALAGLWWASLLSGRRAAGLPARLRVTDLAADVGALFDQGAVAVEPARAAVRHAAIQPSILAKEHGGFRRALVAPPPATLRFHARVPDGGALLFAVAVAGEGKRNPDAAGVRFAVAVDGTGAFDRVVNPAARRRDRRWFEERVDLGAFAGRTVEIALRTEADGPGPLAGTPGWSQVRLVAESERDRQAASPSAPNVLVLLVDTLRADRLGCYGARPTLTPTLDALAARGLLFEQSVAQAPWTMPSVATLFTGLHPRSHGMIGGAHLWGSPQPGRDTDDEPEHAFLADGLPTLAEWAARAGITTVGVAANPLVGRATNMARGFETFVEFEWDEKRAAPPDAALVNAAFLDWLGANRHHRFLAYLHYMEPHDPYTPPEEIRPAAPAGVRPAVASGEVGALARKVNWGGGPPLAAVELDHLRRLYDGEVRAWDRELERLVAALRDLDVLDTTVVVMTADHGEAFQEHGRLKHGGDLYEELLRVPLVVAGPGIASGRRRDQAQGIDVFPTVAGLLGFAPPPGLPGRDLLRTGEARPAISETRYGPGPDGAPTPLVSLRQPPWKLIQAPAAGRFELYDLARDPGERDDRFGAAPEGARLAALLARWQAAAAPPSVAGQDPAVRERLRALGYVQ